MPQLDFANVAHAVPGCLDGPHLRGCSTYVLARYGHCRRSAACSTSAAARIAGRPRRRPLRPRPRLMRPWPRCIPSTRRASTEAQASIAVCGRPGEGGGSRADPGREPNGWTRSSHEAEQVGSPRLAPRRWVRCVRLRPKPRTSVVERLTGRPAEEASGERSRRRRARRTRPEELPWNTSTPACWPIRGLWVAYRFHSSSS